jgi:hypothetical protein
MVTKTAVVIRGTVEVVDRAGVLEQRRINQLDRGGGYGFGARNLQHRRCCKPGELVTLEAGEIEWLAGLGIVRIVS